MEEGLSRPVDYGRIGHLRWSQMYETCEHAACPYVPLTSTSWGGLQVVSLLPSSDSASEQTEPRCYILELPPELRLLMHEQLWIGLGLRARAIDTECAVSSCDRACSPWQLPVGAYLPSPRVSQLHLDFTLFAATSTSQHPHHIPSSLVLSMTGEQTMPPCYILKLPPEARLLIYEQLWHDSRAPSIHVKDRNTMIRLYGRKSQPEYLQPVDGRTLALLLSCKTIYQEAQPVASQQLRFEVAFYDPAYGGKPGLSWRVLPKTAYTNLLQQMRNVQIEVHDTYTAPEEGLRTLRELPQLIKELQPHCANKTLRVVLASVFSLLMRASVKRSSS